MSSGNGTLIWTLPHRALLRKRRPYQFERVSCGGLRCGAMHDVPLDRRSRNVHGESVRAAAAVTVLHEALRMNALPTRSTAGTPANTADSARTSSSWPPRTGSRCGCPTHCRAAPTIWPPPRMHRDHRSPVRRRGPGPCRPRGQGPPGTGIGIHTPTKVPADGNTLDVDTVCCNPLLSGLRASANVSPRSSPPGERSWRRGGESRRSARRGVRSASSASSSGSATLGCVRSSTGTGPAVRWCRRLSGDTGDNAPLARYLAMTGVVVAFVGPQPTGRRRRGPG